MKNKPLTVSQVVKTLKQTINQNDLLRNVALVGELSNFNPHRSGHFYFTMKDETSRIDCVMFSGNTKVKFNPKDGDKVIVTGYCDIYIPGGRVQVYANTMNLDGLGDLHIRFEELKKKLHKEGHFKPELKKPIEKYPQHIAVISAKDSAAHADITKTLKERWPLAIQSNYFAYVQGDNAAPSLIAQLKQANLDNTADTIILSRGGGSIEDLWAFNDEELIKTIVASAIPVICGVGHESDNTLSELAADLRAATPTAAAVAATPNQFDVKKQLRDYMNHFYIQVKRKNEQNIHQYKSIVDSSYLSSPERFFGTKQQRIDEINMNFNQVMNRFQNINRKLANQESEMIHRFKRILEKEDNLIQSMSVDRKHRLENLFVQKKHAIVSRTPSAERYYGYVKSNESNLEIKKRDLNRLIFQKIKDEKQNFVYLVDKIHNLSPLEIMKRGFSLASVNGNIVKSIQDVDREDELKIRVVDGIIEARVIKKKGFESNE